MVAVLFWEEHVETAADFRLEDGRRVWLMALATRNTYHTAMEGSEEDLSRLYRDQGLAQWVATIGKFAVGCECSGQVMDPGTPVLPPVICVAYFKMFGQGQA